MNRFFVAIVAIVCFKYGGVYYMKTISIVTDCYNKEDNIEKIYQQVKMAFDNTKDYTYEHIFIDNDSRDRTVAILKEIARNDKNVKIIVNSRNFGNIRSPYYGLLQGNGDAVISLAAHLQEPAEFILKLIKKWEDGFKIVIGIKANNRESGILFIIRKFYYNFLNRFSETTLVNNYAGFGLYDRQIIEILRKINDTYPYFRGLICDIGFQKAQVEYVQTTRERGITKNNFYELYDMAMLGITNHSKIPLRLAVMLGFIMAIISLLVAVGYLFYKIVFWTTFSVGIAPIVIGLFFFASVQLFFLGIIGEYIGAVHTQVLKRPLVIEKERINF